MPGIFFSTIHKGEKGESPAFDHLHILEDLPSKRAKVFSLFALLAVLSLLFVIFKGWQRVPTTMLDVPPRCIDFMGREREQAYLKRELFKELPGSNFVTIYGQGGIGKTELAVAFVQDHLKDFSLICWIDGSSEEAMARSYENMGDIWGIKEEDIGKLKEKVHRKLENFQGKPWLLVFDDVRIPLTHFPKSGGRCLVTCRDKNLCPTQVALELTQNPEEAVLLLARLTGEERSETMKLLAQKLDYLPLMINIAGHYIAETPGINLTNYSEMLSSLMQTEHSPLLAREFWNRYPRSLSATYSITLDLLQKKHPLSHEFLQQVIFLNPKNIPAEFLTRWLEAKSKYSTAEINLLKGDVLRELQNHSLLRYDCDNDTLTIHESLHQALSLELKKEDRSLEVLKILSTFDSIHRYNPTRKETIRPFQKVLPHCTALLEQIKSPSRLATNLALTVSRYFIDTEHDLCRGEAYLSLAKKWTRGSHHPVEGRVAFLYGVLRFRQATKLNEKNEKYLQALDFFQEALAHFQMHNNDQLYEGIEQNPSKCTKEYQRAICLQYQGQMLRLLGRLDEAEAKLQQALEAFQILANGKDHFDIARIFREQGILLGEKGEYQAAIKKIEEAIAMQQRTYAAAYSSQPTVAATYRTLGDYLFKMGEFSKADQAYQKSIEINIEAYQTDIHPYLSDLYHRRSVALLAEGKKREAEKMEKKSQSIQALLK